MVPPGMALAPSQQALVDFIMDHDQTHHHIKKHSMDRCWCTILANILHKGSPGTFCFTIIIGRFLQQSIIKNLIPPSLGGRKTAQEKKKQTNSWERRFPGTFRTNVPLILPIFSVFSQWEEGQKFPGTLFLGTCFSYFRWFLSFRITSKSALYEPMPVYHPGQHST